MANAVSPRPTSASLSGAPNTAVGAPSQNGAVTTAATAATAGGAPGTAAAAAAGPNRCHTCQGEIKAAQFIRVGEFKFHKDHFTCCMCNKSLHGQKFHPKDGKFYCADDFILKVITQHST